MSPASIIQKVQADGIELKLSPTGTIKMIGENAAADRWLTVIRENKQAIIAELQIEEVRNWLINTGRSAEDYLFRLIIEKCHNDAEALKYFLQYSRPKRQETLFLCQIRSA